ncbi:hypothetical protein AB0M02_15390 [Actinoplanes sp. NPDC051861]|uniref:DUF6174 domain-containing protein n=1 Tax=Actinoplanes sp. NPDC051861 TaxID=3155170 RepID=UPI00342125A4
MAPNCGGREAEVVVRFERALCALVLVGLVGGCSSSGDEAKPTFSEPAASAPAVTGGSAPAWTEPASYSYELVRGCDASAPLGHYKATVQGGVVTSAERIGAPAAAPSASAEVDLGPITGDPGEEIEVPTLAELVTMAQTATEDGAEVTTEFDATDGHPVKVTVNVSDTAAEAECWTVSAYQP